MSIRNVVRQAPSPRTCPRLGAQGDGGARSEPILYPSFENHCWAAPQPSTILLTDQATLCLCPAHRTCPRLLAARATGMDGSAPVSAAATPPATAPVQSNLDDDLDNLRSEIDASRNHTTQIRRQWGWIGAGLIFMSSLLCGGFFAAYVGWQLIGNELLAPAPGFVDTVAAAPTAAGPQLYLIVTATSEPNQHTAPDAGAPLAAEIERYPVAVTPTPVVMTQGTGTLLVPPQDEAAPALDTAPDPAQLAQAAMPTPPFDMQLEIPTRRPTPVLDIPTSTPSPDEPTATNTPVPLVGPPLVLFSAKDSSLLAGECTTVSWVVENVRAVYYENLGVNGQGEKEECVRDKDGLYTLAVVFTNGDTRIYTTTVEIVFPTPTPMPTPTFTDVPPATPTWTPEAPTATPTPNIQYGVNLSANTTTLRCTVGQTCETDLYVTNTGSAIDNMSVIFVEAGPWPAQLCRLDGVCSANTLTLVSMGPSNTGVVRLRLTPPEGSPYTESSYRLQAVSDGSKQIARSEVVTIRIASQ